jgi:Polysaccharide deacetylase
MSKPITQSIPKPITKLILLSFDLEEFDIPEEYGQPLTDEVKFEVTCRGLKPLLQLLDRLQVRATFFITAHFAKTHPKQVLEISQRHEIASHGFYHSSFEVADLEKSRVALEEICGTAVTGFRMPRLKPVSDRAIAAAGYTYNSSMNPTYLPGRYNNFFKPRTAYFSHQLLNLPVSVTPLIRFPLFWLSFKNLPLWMYRKLSRLTLDCDRYLNLYFHPWEFADISQFRLPGYVKRHGGKAMLQRLEHYLIWLQTQGEWATCSEFQREMEAILIGESDRPLNMTL